MTSPGATARSVARSGEIDDSANSAEDWSNINSTGDSSALGYIPEVVWNESALDGGSGLWASGGGASTAYAQPSWQTEVSGAAAANGMRGVPDVAGDADPETGYDVRIDGTDTVIGGTSAVAPLWAALIARINQTSGKSAGYLNPTLYKNPQALRDITQGNNGDYDATAGWDACTGLGSPNGKLLGGVL